METGTVLWFSFFYSKFWLISTWFSSLHSLSVSIFFPKQHLHKVPVICLPLSGLHLIVPRGRHFDWYSINRQTQTSDREAFVLVSAASSFTINSLRCVDARNAESDPSPSRVAAHWPGIRLRASSETSFPPHLCSVAALSLSLVWVSRLAVVWLPDSLNISACHFFSQECVIKDTWGALVSECWPSDFHSSILGVNIQVLSGQKICLLKTLSS